MAKKNKPLFKVVNIDGTDIPVINYKGFRVVDLNTVKSLHAALLNNRFTGFIYSQAERFVESIDCFTVCDQQEIDEIRKKYKIRSGKPDQVLYTRSGYEKICDLAAISDREWKRNAMLNAYFVEADEVEDEEISEIDTLSVPQLLENEPAEIIETQSQEIVPYSSDVLLPRHIQHMHVLQNYVVELKEEIIQQRRQLNIIQELLEENNAKSVWNVESIKELDLRTTRLCELSEQASNEAASGSNIITFPESRVEQAVASEELLKQLYKKEGYKSAESIANRLNIICTTSHKPHQTLVHAIARYSNIGPACKDDLETEGLPPSVIMKNKYCIKLVLPDSKYPIVLYSRLGIEGIKDWWENELRHFAVALPYSKKSKIHAADDIKFQGCYVNSKEFKVFLPKYLIPTALKNGQKRLLKAG